MNCHEAAIKYIKEGKSVIITNGKIPALETWKEFQQRIPNEETLDMWWGANPKGNVAIVTGRISNITVIDVDGERGQESLKKFNIQLPPTKINKTPNGWHYIYQYNEEYPQGVGILPGIDIRNDGGYIIAAPSSINGGVYEEIVDCPPVKLPSVEVIFNGHSPKREAIVANPQWVEELLRIGSAEGQRNKDAARLAGHYRTKNIGSLETFEIMKIFAERCKPEMDKNELWNTISSIYKYAGSFRNVKVTEAPEMTEYGDGYLFTWKQYGVTITVEKIDYAKEGLRCEIDVEVDYPGEPKIQHGPVRTNFSTSRTKAELIRGLTTRIPFDWGTVVDIIARMTIERVREGATIEHVSSISAVLEEELWLLQPFVQEGEITVLFGDAGTGKSTIALACGLAVASGSSEILGFIPKKQMPVLYLDWESNGGTQRRRTDKILATIKRVAPDVPLYYQQCVHPLEAIAQSIKKQVQKHGIGLVIADSAVWACSGDPQSPEGVASVMRPLRSFGTAALVIAHQPKNNLDSDKPYGSTFWNAAPRSTIKVERKNDPDNPIMSVLLTNPKSNNASYHTRLSYQILHTQDTLSFTETNPEEKFFEKLPLWKKIDKVLADGIPRTVKDICFLTGNNIHTVRKELSRNQDRFVQEAQGSRGRGSESRWTLMRQTNEASQNTPLVRQQMRQNEADIPVNEIIPDI